MAGAETGRGAEVAAHGQLCSLGEHGSSQLQTTTLNVDNAVKRKKLIFARWF